MEVHHYSESNSVLGTLIFYFNNNQYILPTHCTATGEFLSRLDLTSEKRFSYSSDFFLKKTHSFNDERLAYTDTFYADNGNLYTGPGQYGPVPRTYAEHKATINQYNGFLGTGVPDIARNAELYPLTIFRSSEHLIESLTHYETRYFEYQFSGDTLTGFHVDSGSDDLQFDVKLEY